MYNITVSILDTRDMYYNPTLDHYSSTPSEGYTGMGEVDYELEYEVYYTKGRGDTSVGEPYLVYDIERVTLDGEEVDPTSQVMIKLEEYLYDNAG